MQHDFQPRWPRRRRMWGAVLVIVGTYFLLHRLDVIELIDILALWPFVIVAFGLAGMLSARHAEHVADDLFHVMLGLWFYAISREMWGWTWENSWPILLVAYGITTIAGSVFRLRQQFRKESS